MRRSLRSPLTTLAFASGLFLFFVARSADPSHAIFTDTESLRLRFEAGSWGGCVRSMGFWKNHPEDWPVDEISLGGVVYSQEAAIAILDTPAKGDATYVLAQQLIVAKLNVASGGDGSAINETIQAADVWITTHPLGSDPDKEAREEGIELAELLESYNVGEGSAPACQDESPDEVEDISVEGGEEESSTPAEEQPGDEENGAEASATPPAEPEEAQGTPET